jgi:hypothetical protein
VKLAWRDETEPVAVHPLAAFAAAHGLAAALDAVAATRRAALCVALPGAVRSRIDAFLAAHDVESGGLLLGRRHAIGARAPAGASDTPLVAIERFVPGRVFEGTGVSLALGTEVWDDARPLLDGGLAVIGWVHSHPGLGAFFSGTDRRTQRAFFAQPWQVGAVIDPLRGEEAWFRGADAVAGDVALRAV